MTDKEALELLNMFTTAAQIAKSRNKFEYTLNLNENDLNKKTHGLISIFI